MKWLSVLSVAKGLPVALALLLPTTAAMAAAPKETVPSPAITGPALRAAVREALTATRKQPQPNDAAVQKLTALYRTLQADTSLSRSQRETLRLAVRARLKTWATRLEQSTASTAGAALPKRLPPPQQKAGEQGASAQVLAQQGLPGGGQQPATTQPPTDHSQQLLDVIQDTIAPDTWDVRGGLGVIRVWPPGSALVVRQTGSVHESLGRLLGDLRQ